MKKKILIAGGIMLAAIAFPNNAWSAEPIVIEVRTTGREIEVIDRDFFKERARPPQTIANRDGVLRYTDPNRRKFQEPLVKEEPKAK